MGAVACAGDAKVEGSEVVQRSAKMDRKHRRSISWGFWVYSQTHRAIANAARRKFKLGDICACHAGEGFCGCLVYHRHLSPLFI